MAPIRIKILSDLHLEAPSAYDVFEITPNAPYLALLGDIGYVKDEGFFQFLKKQLFEFEVVFFLFGNHEPYHISWSAAKEDLNVFQNGLRESRRAGEKLGEFVLLDQTRYDISRDVTILGCTLFSRVLPAQADFVSWGLNDFYYIKNWDIERHTAAHFADLAWLNAQVTSISSADPDRKIAIFTHYNPSTNPRTFDSVHANSNMSSGFSTDLSLEPCWTNPSVKLWAFGHTHFNCYFRDLPTRKIVFTNQKGYYMARSEGFEETMVIEL